VVLVVQVLLLILHHCHPGDPKVAPLCLLVYPMPVPVWLRLGPESDEYSPVVAGWTVMGSWGFLLGGRPLLLMHVQCLFP